MAEIEIEAKTVEEAIQDGLKKLNVPRENVEIKILDEGASGLFGLMGTKPARVRLVTKETGATGAVCETTADLALAQTRVKEILGDILKLMNIPFTGITTSLMTGRVLVEVTTTESNVLIGKNGQSLEALENIVNLILNRDERTRVKTTLDVEGYRLRQEERLQTMAKKAADQVKSTKKTFRFEPMSSRERRIIHLTLKPDTEIETYSEGEGSSRKVVIKPKK